MPDEPSSPPPAPPEALGADLRSLWELDPAVVFLNHGSFGATPRAVLEAQAGWRRRLEANRVVFLDGRGRALIEEAKVVVGEGFQVSVRRGFTSVPGSLSLPCGAM